MNDYWLYSEIQEKAGAHIAELESERLTITEEGVRGNISRIFDHYIKNAGSCIHYNSDVLFDIDNINEYLKSLASPKHRPYMQFYSGFRILGVDGESFIETRLESPEIYGGFWEEYDSILCLDAKEEEGTIQLTLYEITRERK